MWFHTRDGLGDAARRNNIGIRVGQLSRQIYAADRASIAIGGMHQDGDALAGFADLERGSRMIAVGGVAGRLVFGGRMRAKRIGAGRDPAMLRLSDRSIAARPLPLDRHAGQTRPRNAAMQD